MTDIMQLPNRASWTERASCREVYPDAFYPEKGEVDKATVTRAAKRVCASCPVRTECLAKGMSEDWGIWGGLDESERKALKQRKAS